MALDYETDRKLKAIAPVIDDHAEWFGRANKRIFFPQAFKGRDRLEVPDRFQQWLKEASGYDFIEKTTLHDLNRLYEELHIVATGLMNKVSYTNELITLKEYDDFTSLYENFVFKLRRLEQDCALADSGLDAETGLRSRSAMETDMARELERRARRGNPIALALARIDNYDAIKSRIDPDQLKRVLVTLGRLIKRCARSFDDAYRSGDGEFIMSLKHSEAAGGTAAVNRLRSFLADEKIILRIDGKDMPLTMSYCVAEPVPGDTLDELLRNMRHDLSQWNEGGDTALEYHEQSPLQRFIDGG